MRLVESNETHCIKPETGDKIESSETLKILCFEFDRNPNPGKQIDRIISKFSARTWSLRYLKRSDMQTLLGPFTLHSLCP